MEIVNDSNKLCLPENLRLLRKRFNWSQDELAEKIGLNRGNIASYENGTAEPKICNLVKFARLFSLSVYDLTHGNLKEEDSYRNATHRHTNGAPVMLTQSFEQLTKDAADFQDALKGLHCLVRLKINGNGELSSEVQFLKEQFEQLHGVAQHLLTNHLDLIALVKTRCKGNASE